MYRRVSISLYIYICYYWGKGWSITAYNKVHVHCQIIMMLIIFHGGKSSCWERDRGGRILAPKMWSWLQRDEISATGMMKREFVRKLLWKFWKVSKIIHFQFHYEKDLFQSFLVLQFEFDRDGRRSARDRKYTIHTPAAPLGPWETPHFSCGIHIIYIYRYI